MTLEAIRVRERDHQPYRTMFTTERGVADFHVHAGRCEHDYKVDGTIVSCYWQAAYRMIPVDGEPMDMCASCVPDLWEQAAEGHVPDFKPTVLKFDRGCEKVAEREHFPGSEVCGRSAALTLIHPDGTTKSYCWRHARQSWLEMVRIDDEEAAEVTIHD